MAIVLIALYVLNVVIDVPTGCFVAAWIILAVQLLSKILLFFDGKGWK